MRILAQYQVKHWMSQILLVFCALKLGGFFSIQVAAQSVGGNLLRTFTGHQSIVTFVIAADDGFLYSAGTDFTLRKWNVSDGILVFSWPVTNGVYSIVVDVKNGYVYASLTSDNMAVQLSYYNSTQLRTFTVPSDSVTTIQLVANDFLYAGCYDKILYKFWIINGSQSATLSGHTAEIMNVQASVDSIYIYSGSLDRTIRRWFTVGNDSLSLVISTPFSNYGLLLYDGSVYTGMDNYAIRRVDAITGIYISRYLGHSGNIYGLNACNEYLFSASLDTTVRQWLISNGSTLFTYQAYSYTRSVSVTKDYWVVFIGSFDMTIYEYQMFLTAAITTTTSSTSSTTSTTTTLSSSTTSSTSSAISSTTASTLIQVISNQPSLPSSTQQASPSNELITTAAPSGESTSGSSSSFPIAVIAGIGGGAVSLIVAAAAAFYISRKRRLGRNDGNIPDDELNAKGRDLGLVIKPSVNPFVDTVFDSASRPGTSMIDDITPVDSSKLHALHQVSHGNHSDAGAKPFAPQRPSSPADMSAIQRTKIRIRGRTLTTKPGSEFDLPNNFRNFEETGLLDSSPDEASVPIAGNDEADQTAPPDYTELPGAQSGTPDF